jgi:hypothetical protein
MTRQQHDFLEIFYVLDGAGAFHIDERKYSCGKGNVVVVPVGRAHRLEDDPSAIWGPGQRTRSQKRKELAIELIIYTGDSSTC